VGSWCCGPEGGRIGAEEGSSVGIVGAGAIMVVVVVVVVVVGA